MKKHPNHVCTFDKSASKKCKYCTTQNALCVPVSFPTLVRSGTDMSQIPWFCAEEFAALELSNTPEATVAAATTMDEIITVAASEAPKTIGEVNFAVLEELRAVRADLQVSQPRKGTESVLTVVGSDS
jgi:hypothetical protein